MKIPDIYVATLEGNVKDNYMSIGTSKDMAVREIIKGYFEEEGYKEKDLEDVGIYIRITSFENGKRIDIS